MQAGSQKRPKKSRIQQNMERNRLVEELDALDTTPDPLSLLNFSLPEVQRGPRQTPKPKKSTTPYQKERFMQANYKFAVCPSIYDSIVDSYSRTRRCFDGTTENVDKILDYKDISQVVFTVNKWPHQCIICLGAPQCPKISACGHVFCWTCIIQYFASKIEVPDIPSILKQRCACPVCQSNLHLEDFRPVQLVFQEKTATQKTVKFNLVMREKTSTVVCLSSQETSFHRTIPVSSVQSRVNFVPLSFPSLGSVHASVNRVNVAFAEDMERIWAAEDKELEAIIKESLSSQDPALPTMLLAQDIHKGQKLLFLENENRYVHKHPALSLPSSTPLSGSGNDLVFFYQENSGAHVFLHPISVRWLLKEYQTQENLPKLIEGDVILFEDEITQDEASRKRYRFLGHLPICCNFQFCLVNVGALLSPANLAGFKQEVNALKQQIQKHSKERQQHEFHQQKQMQEKYLKESTVSQAILYEKYANPETVSRDANNFPSLPASSQQHAGNHPNYHGGKNQGWNNYIGTSHLIESMIWESQPVLKRPEAFPSLSPSPAPAAVAPAPAPAPATQQKAPPAVWGNTQHLKDAGRAKPPQNQQRNNHPVILNFDYKFRS